MYQSVTDNSIAELLHKNAGFQQNENGSIQPNVDGLSDSNVKNAFTELFLKVIRSNNSTELILNNVSTILNKSTEHDMTDNVDGLSVLNITPFAVIDKLCCSIVSIISFTVRSFSRL